MKKGRIFIILAALLALVIAYAAFAGNSAKDAQKEIIIDDSLPAPEPVAIM